MSSSPRIRHIADFSDKLNPMLVKELRQGLRGLSFVILFIALQAFLALILLTTAAGASYQNAGHLLSRIIFFFFAIAVLIVQPLRGVSALSNEIKGNTIDLLCLTRLSAWRITFGKWISIVSQSALLLTAIIPYLILRYFFGDMQILSELLLVLSLFLLSLTFTAITVSLSSIPSVILRVLIPIIASVYTFGAISSSFISGRRSYQNVLDLVTWQHFSDVMNYLGFVSICAYVCWLSLDLGASKIAPAAENRATTKRLLSLLFIGLTFTALSLSDAPAGTALIAALLLSLPICFFSFTESSDLLPSIVAPFARRGVAGRLLGRIAYPGWASALLFALLLHSSMLVAYYLMPAPHHALDDHLLPFINSSFAMLFMALTLTRLTTRQHNKTAGWLLLFIVSQFLVLSLLVAIEEWYPEASVMPWFCWVPTTIVALNPEHGFPTSSLTPLSAITAGSYFALAFLSSLPSWKRIHRLENQVKRP